MSQVSTNYPQNRTILQGQVLEKLKEIPDEHIDCIITSPPYYKLRSYGVAGEWGKEETFTEYLAKMQNLMRELRRVLKKTGSCWINIGDLYGTHASGEDTLNPSAIHPDELQNYHKSRLGIPARFMIQSIDDGWILRNDLIWQKLNPMPSSTKDRLTNTYEPVYFFVKNTETVFWFNKVTGQSVRTKPIGVNGLENIDWQYKDCFACSKTGYIDNKTCKYCDGLGKYKRTLWQSVDYYFNLNGIRKKPKTEIKPFNIRVRDAKKGKGQLKLGDDPRAWKASESEMENYDDNGVRKYSDQPHSNTTRLGQYRDNQRKQDSTLGPDGKPKTNYAGFNERWKEQYEKRIDEGRPESSCRTQSGLLAGNDLPRGVLINQTGKNPGDVWSFSSEPLAEKHYASFPTSLPLEILKCACPQQVCSECGMPRYPIIKPTKNYENYLESIKGLESGNLEKGYQNYKNNTLSTTSSYEVVDFSKCDCNAKFQAGIVLDPFMGSGTTAVAAEELGLNWIGVELKQEYIDIARKRLKPYMNERLTN